MTTFDTEFRQLAVDMINEFGKMMSIDVVELTYDPTAGRSTATPPDPSLRNVKGVPPYNASLAYQPGTVLPEGAMYTLIAAQGLAFVPKRGMRLLFDSRVFNIVKVDEIWSGELVAAYGLMLNE